MDNIPAVSIVITTPLLLIVLIVVILYCCSNNRGYDEPLDKDKVQCVRLQIKSASTDDSQWINIFEIDEDQPPPYEFPPAYKNIYLVNTGIRSTAMAMT